MVAYSIALIALLSLLSFSNADILPEIDDMVYHTADILLILDVRSVMADFGRVSLLRKSIEKIVRWFHIEKNSARIAVATIGRGSKIWLYLSHGNDPELVQQAVKESTAKYLDRNRPDEMIRSLDYTKYVFDAEKGDSRWKMDIVIVISSGYLEESHRNKTAEKFKELRSKYLVVCIGLKPQDKDRETLREGTTDYLYFDIQSMDQVDSVMFEFMVNVSCCGFSRSWSNEEQCIFESSDLTCSRVSKRRVNRLPTCGPPKCEPLIETKVCARRHTTDICYLNGGVCKRRTKVVEIDEDMFIDTSCVTNLFDDNADCDDEFCWLRCQISCTDKRVCATLEVVKKCFNYKSFISCCAPSRSDCDNCRSLAMEIDTRTSGSRIRRRAVHNHDDTTPAPSPDCYLIAHAVQCPDVTKCMKNEYVFSRISPGTTSYTVEQEYHSVDGLCKDLSIRLACQPWFEKIRLRPRSCDGVLPIECSGPTASRGCEALTFDMATTNTTSKVTWTTPHTEADGRN